MMTALMRALFPLKAWLMKRRGDVHKNYRVLQAVHIRLFFDDRRQTAYLNMQKVASTSLIHTLLESEEMRQGLEQAKKQNKIKTDQIQGLIRQKHLNHLFPVNIKTIRFQAKNKSWPIQDSNEKEATITSKEISAFFIFTFVRNPFDRLVSFFQNKYIYKNGGYNFYQLAKQESFFPKVGSFAELAHKMSKAPDAYLNEHIEPQYLKIDRLQDLGAKINFIGKFENLESDFEKIRTKFHLLPLEQRMKSTGEHSDWRDYYTPRTAKMIYKRYRKDFERFGYQDEYPKLLAYLKTKSREAKK